MLPDRTSKVVYVSYDGALDPLGTSQIIPYLRRLASDGVTFTLITFEKTSFWSDTDSRRHLEETLRRCEITWLPLTYHKRPRVPATVLDLVAGAARIRQAVRATASSIVHCRGDLPMLMARMARLPKGTRLLYDIRGFWSDERVETGSWSRGSPLDRVVRRTEAANLSRADALVVLTRAALRTLERRRSPLPPHQVVPTCVDLDAFAPARGATSSFGPAYCGSFGPRYLPGEIIRFVRTLSDAMARPALFLTPQVDEARRHGVSSDWADLLSVRSREVPAKLSQALALAFFYQPGRHAAATCPTRLAEALALGLPVACNAGIGDLDELLEKHQVGVIVRAMTDEAFKDAATRLQILLSDPSTPERCQQLARSIFSADEGAARYRELYDALSGEP